MFSTKLPIIHTDKFSRCDERRQKADSSKNLSPIQRKDATIKEAVYQALWKNSVLRAIEYYEIDAYVKDGTVYLYGHIVGTSSQLRILNAIGTIPGIVGIKNHLVLDDKLTLEVATSLGQLEHTYACKFFTGASHGAVSVNGIVNNQNIKSLAEKCVASNSKVRGVINNVKVSHAGSEVDQLPFLQPATGETIYFSDGLSAVVKQVIMNPNNRCVIAMIVQGNFSEGRNILHPLSDGKTRLLEQLIVVPMKLVRYLTKTSGFLYIQSNEREQYTDFDPASFHKPRSNWTPPYPYCPNDILFPVDYQADETQIKYGSRQSPSEELMDGTSVRKQVFANDSIGG